ncbi:hypothetical protein MLD38_034309 [Melastoma candidum]|uniref:Uncharacterized protein n=1 Tax=Melastoma candidum TaxID=119954 RepID=A0ACB9MDR0_9MYRT|nr:hypothetical protein MLD38_034309 [Melastoma candidum]
MSGGEANDRSHLLRVNTTDLSAESDGDLEAQRGSAGSEMAGASGSPGLRDLFRQLDRGLSGRRHSFKRIDRNRDREVRDGYETRERPDHHDAPFDLDGDVLGESAPPEWALLLIGCLLGLATGLFVAAFNNGVHLIHEWAWAGTPNEGAAWLRLQRLADTWHRILLIPVTGGVIVGMMHGLLEILDQIKQSISSQRQGFDVLAGVFPTVKAIQAAVTLGTGCSLGPEGPSVDIGKSCAYGFSLMMENNRERKIALVAAGAAAGISSGFNAPLAGSFFAIETVLRPLRAENSPPFTTAMIILASVISSTVSNVLLGTQSAFTVPAYDLKSAAELPLYLILGMICGVVSVAFTRLVSWFGKFFEFIKEKYGIPLVVCPALGGLGAGIIALKYPGILYWGFTNVEEILHTGKTASAPGIWLLTQLVAAKVIATALCKGAGLVGGLYAPSLMIGAAAGAVFGGSAAEVVNSAIPGNAAVAQPQAYALVGMAATLASVCSVPLTSVLLLFELTKDYRILLPLMGAVGLAIWVPSVTNQSKDSDATDAQSPGRGYSHVSPSDDKSEVGWRRPDGQGLELPVLGKGADLVAEVEDTLLKDIKVSRAMVKNYLKVTLDMTIKDTTKFMLDNHMSCALIVDDEELLEGIVTYGDIRRFLSRNSKDLSKGDTSFDDVNAACVSSACTRKVSYRGQERGIFTCYPDADLETAKEIMEAKGVKQLPVVKRGGDPHKERKRRVVGMVYYDEITGFLRDEVRHRKAVNQRRKENNFADACTNSQ